MMVTTTPRAVVALTTFGNATNGFAARASGTAVLT